MKTYICPRTESITIELSSVLCASGKKVTVVETPKDFYTGD